MFLQILPTKMHITVSCFHIRVHYALHPVLLFACWILLFMWTTLYEEEPSHLIKFYEVCRISRHFNRLAVSFRHKSVRERAFKIDSIMLRPENHLSLLPKHSFHGPNTQTFCNSHFIRASLICFLEKGARPWNLLHFNRVCIEEIAH